MIVLASGEGPTDLGTTYGGQHRYGPVAYLLAQLGVPLSPDADWRWVSKQELKDHSRTILPGKKTPSGGAYFRRNTIGLGRIAKGEPQPAIAIFFRDSDSTRSSPRKQWEDQWSSIEAGFNEAAFEDWIGLLPRPKSEVWLLCGMKSNPYQGCQLLEEAPGNDASPNSPKHLLDRAAERREIGTSAQELAQWVQDREILAERIAMPSWQKVIERTSLVMGRLAG